MSELVNTAKKEWQQTASEVFANSIMLYHFYIRDANDFSETVTLELHSQALDKTAAVKITYEMLTDCEPVVRLATIREMIQRLHDDK